MIAGEKTIGEDVMIIQSSFPIPGIVTRNRPPSPAALGEPSNGQMLQRGLGVLGPAGMSKDIVDRLNAEINKIMTSREVEKKLADMGMQVAAITPREFGSIIRDDAERYGRLIQELNISIDE